MRLFPFCPEGECGDRVGGATTKPVLLMAPPDFCCGFPTLFLCRPGFYFGSKPERGS